MIVGVADSAGDVAGDGVGVALGSAKIALTQINPNRQQTTRFAVISHHRIDESSRNGAKATEGLSTGETINYL